MLWSLEKRGWRVEWSRERQCRSNRKSCRCQLLHPLAASLVIVSRFLFWSFHRTPTLCPLSDSTQTELK